MSPYSGKVRFEVEGGGGSSGDVWGRKAGSVETLRDLNLQHTIQPRAT